MKIAFFNFSSLQYGGGCEQNFMRLGQWLLSQGDEVAFVTGSIALNQLLCTLLRQGLHTQNFSDAQLAEVFSIRQYTTFDIWAAVGITRKAKQIRALFREVDVVITKNEFHELFLLRCVFRVDFTKVLIGVHTPILYPVAQGFKDKLHNLLYGSCLYRWLVKDAHLRVLTPPEAMSDWVAEKILTQKQGVYVPNSVDLTRYTPGNVSQDPVFRVLFVGRLESHKGVDILVEAIERSVSKELFFAEMRFAFVGSGSFESLVQHLTSAEKNVVFYGFQANVEEYYRDADLVVVPSRLESFCFTAAEAQACGVPVVTTNIPGPRDIVLHGETGWVVEPGQPVMLARAIKEAYTLWRNNREQYVKMSRTAATSIASRFSRDYLNRKLYDYLAKNVALDS